MMRSVLAGRDNNRKVIERRKVLTNLPKRVVAPGFMGINKEFFSGAARPELKWKLEENLCIYHHVTFLYGLCFPTLFH